MNSNEDLQKGKLLRRKMHAYQRDKNEEFSTNERGIRNCCMSKKYTSGGIAQLPSRMP